jgi:hypothetical protein
MPTETLASDISQNKQVVSIGSATGLYETLRSAREPYLHTAQLCASLTLPYICPPSEGNPLTADRAKYKENLNMPRNGIGARGVKNLASNLVLALFPANVPFFRFSINEAILNEADALEEEVGLGQETDQAGNVIQAGGSFRSEIGKKLLGFERNITSRTDRKAHRKVIYEAMKKLIVTGNVLLRWLPDGKLRTHSLGSYVVERDYSGTPYRVILRESKMVQLLDDELREQVLTAQPELVGKPDAECSLTTYWGAMDNSEQWETWQEVGKTGIVVPESYGTYKAEDVPVSPQRFVASDDQDYGIGLCEEHIADLMDLEELEVNVKEISKAISKVIPLIDPNGMTEVHDIANAGNLEFVAGRDEDISVVTLLDKVNDYQAAQHQIDKITRRLEQVFLLYTSVQRDAERVTAEEIRYIANELEKGHGGLYTVLADEFQRPYVQHMVSEAIKDGDLPRELFVDGDIQPEIVTGIDAIGRGQDIEALREIIQLGQNVEEIRSELNWSEVLTRYFVARGLELDGLLKDENQKVAEQQQALAAQRTQMADGVEADLLAQAGRAGIEQQQVPVPQ